MRGRLDTAGELLSFDCSLGWVGELIAEGASGELSPLDESASSVDVRVEEDNRAFDTRGFELLTHRAWRRGGEVVMENVCTSGFDLRVLCGSDRASFTFRWRPPTRDKLAARLLRSRFHLLARAVLMQYPALWWAGTRGRAPLHASACVAGGPVPLLVAAGGVGRSTLLLRELEAGGSATGDNLAVGDGTTIWGLVEPLRVEGSGGRRMPHGRTEVSMTSRAAALVPDSLVILERGLPDRPSLERCSSEAASRALVTSTYMAEELRRFWGFSSTLARGTGVGPAHPPITAVAAAFAARLPCLTLSLGSTPGARVSDLLDTLEVAA